MTSDEIIGLDAPAAEFSMEFWLREIAFQLAAMNERHEKLDKKDSEIFEIALARVFGKQETAEESKP